MGHKITMLGTGLIGMFYTKTLHGQRGRDGVHTVYSRTEERARAFADEWDIPTWTTDVAEAIRSAAPELVSDVAFQSVYTGAGVPEGQKSLAWSVTLQHPERTLKDKEIRAFSEAVWAQVAARVGGAPRA